MRSRFLSTALLLVGAVAAGCASQPESTADSMPPPRSDPQLLEEIQIRAEIIPLSELGADEIVCFYEKPTGSHIVRERCFTRAELARLSEASREFLRSGGRRGSASRVYSVE